MELLLFEKFQPFEHFERIEPFEHVIPPKHEGKKFVVCCL